MSIEKYIKEYKLSNRSKNLLDKKIKEIKKSKYKKFVIILNRRVRGQQRPRVGRWKNIYDPSQKYKNKLWNTIIKKLINEYDVDFKVKRNVKFLENPVYKDISIKIKYYHKIPKSFNDVKKILCLTNLMKVDRIPDIDNIEKLILDTMNKRLIKDDRFIWKLGTEKRWSLKFKCKIIVKYRE